MFFSVRIINSSLQELCEYELKLGSPKKENNITASRELLSLKEIEEISKNPLVTIASHSMSHNSLAELPENWLKWEIKKSKEYIRDLKGNYDLFAYPFGHKQSYNLKVKKILHEEVFLLLNCMIAYAQKDKQTDHIYLSNLLCIL